MMSNHDDDAKDGRTRTNRRKLLSGLGMLSATLTSNVWRFPTAFGADETANGNMHFIGMFTGNGTIPSAFFSDNNSVDSAIKLGEILQPLEGFKSKLIVLKGIDYRSTVENKLGVSADNQNDKPGAPHSKGPAAFLTGGSQGHGNFDASGTKAGHADRISIDKYLAKSLNVKSKFSTLEFGVRCTLAEPLRCISFSGANAPNFPIQDPWEMYGKLVGDGTRTQEEVNRQLAERKSVMDLISKDLKVLNSRLSAADKVRLDSHLTGLRELEEQLSNSTGGVCVAPTMPERMDFKDINLFPTIGKLQTDLMILAHKCGLTRLSTFLWANANSEQTYKFLGISGRDHHNLSHASFDDATSTAQLVKINRWHAEQLNYLMEKLKEVNDSNGKTLLDNTLILWGNELGEGNSHTYKNIPFVIAGGCGGYFKMGRSIRLEGEPHNNLLVSVGNAMGDTGMKSFGIEGVCTGPVKVLKAS